MTCDARSNACDEISRGSVNPGEIAVGVAPQSVCI